MDKTEIDAEASYASRKYEMIQEFNRRRKKHWIAMLICAAFGGLGLHRVYLKQYKWAALLFVLFAVIFVFLSVGPAVPSSYSLTMILVMVWYVIVVVEFFRLTNNADQANAGLRAELEEKYNLESNSTAKTFR